MSKRYVIVTGAAGGIGRASVDRLLKNGFSVFAAELPGKALGSLRDAGDQVIPLPLDLGDEASIDAAIVQVRAHIGQHGQLHALINNAGVDYNGPLGILTSNEIRQMVQVNFLGTVLMSRAALPLLSKGSRLLFTGSAMGLLAVPTVSVYASTKWALEGLADALRLELGVAGIDVVIIEPGVVQTPMTAHAPAMLDRMLSRMDDTSKQRYEGLMRKIVQMSAAPGAGVTAAQVADAISKAVTAHRPKTRYQVGSDSKSVAIIRHLPDRLRDFLQRKGLGI